MEADAGLICIECSAPAPSLYTRYGKEAIRLTQCNRCGKFADKYVEFDNVLLFIDMLLHKPKAYRHILFNGREGINTKRWNASFLLVLLLFEVHLKWKLMGEIQLAAASSPLPSSTDQASFLAAFLSQYAYLFVICLCELAVYASLVAGWSILFVGKAAVRRRLSMILAGLIVSSFAKIMYIVPVIWDYDGIQFHHLIMMTVFTSNMEALSAIFQLPYTKSAAIVMMATIGKYLLKRLLHLVDSTLP